MATWALVAWVLAVVVLHAWVWSGWREGLGAVGHDAGVIERLRVQLREVKPLRPPQFGPRQVDSRRLVQPPVPGRALTPSVQGLAALSSSAALDRVAQRAPEPAEEPVPPSGHGDGEVGPEWPLSTRLVYRVTGNYGGPVHGDAQVEWLRQGARYQVRLTLSVGPSLAAFASRELVSEGEITPQGIVPERYTEDTRLLLGPKRRAVLRREGPELWLADGRTVRVPEGLQDSASQFVHLAWLLLTERVPLELGQVVEFPLALPRGVYPWRYELAGRQYMESEIGHVEVWHVRPLGAPVAGALMAQVWLMPQMDFLPLEMLITQSDDTWVRLVLAERPLQESAPQNSPSSPTHANP